MARRLADDAAGKGENADLSPLVAALAKAPAAVQLDLLAGAREGLRGRKSLKMPDGYKIPPHWHPKRERVTVISGSFKVGMGDSFDATKMTAFPAGSYAYVDPAMHHYGMAAGETVVQISGTAPFQINYVNSGDDPSTKK